MFMKISSAIVMLSISSDTSDTTYFSSFLASYRGAQGLKDTYRTLLGKICRIQ